jgi:hypothetical protein
MEIHSSYPETTRLNQNVRNKISRTALAVTCAIGLGLAAGCSENEGTDNNPSPSPTELSVPEVTPTPAELATAESLPIICPQKKDTDIVRADGYPGLAAEYYLGHEWRGLVEAGLINNLTAREEGRSQFEPEIGDTVQVFVSDCD